jgi:hypothetical protein
MPVRVPKHVVIHPIVLLSVVDHFNRLSRIGNQRRVVGVLLGSWRAGVVDVATSFAGIGLYPMYCHVLKMMISLFKCWDWFKREGRD